MAVSTWLATSAGTSSLAMVTKFTSFGIDLGRTQHAAAEEVGEAARLLDAYALALEIGHRLDLAAHHHRGFKFGQIGG